MSPVRSLRSRFSRPLTRAGERSERTSVDVERPPRHKCYDARVQVRPSIKLVIAGYIASVVFAVALIILLLAWDETSPWKWAVLVLPAVAFFSALRRHIQRRLTKLTIEGDRLRYESGLLSKSTRTMELFKVQDVRVDQSLGQRMLNTGNLSIETAGSSSHITIESIDDPQGAADHILQMARASHPKA